MITPPCVPGYNIRGPRPASRFLVQGRDDRQLVRKLGPILLLAVLGLPVSLLLLGGCAGSRFSGDPGIVFPPAQMRPVHLAITPPVAPLDLGPVHASLASFDDSAAMRRRLMRCAWQSGAQALAEHAIPGTEISTHITGRWPLARTATWLSSSLDTTGTRHFELSDGAPVEYARRHDISHLVVPQKLHYFQPAGADSGALLLTATVAVIDVLEQQVVWSGPLSSDPADLRIFAGIEPAMTPYEQATYAWLLALFRTFDRIEVWPDEDLTGLSLRCHEPPPVFDWPEESAEADTAELQDPPRLDADGQASDLAWQDGAE